MATGINTLLHSDSFFMIILLTVWFALLSAAPLVGEEDDVNLDEIMHTFRGRKLVKRSEDGVGGGEAEEQMADEGWGALGSFNQDGQNAGGGGSASDEAYDDSISPVKGPYMKLAADGLSTDDEDEDDGGDGNNLGGRSAGTGWGLLSKLSYRNWDEYLETQRSKIKDAVQDSRSLVEEGSVLRSVINSDDHFRYMDTLFKEKNDRVKAYHALVLYMKQQGKNFKIPQKTINTISRAILEKHAENKNAIRNELKKGDNILVESQPIGGNFTGNEVKNTDNKIRPAPQGRSLGGYPLKFGGNKAPAHTPFGANVFGDEVKKVTGNHFVQDKGVIHPQTGKNQMRVNDRNMNRPVVHRFIGGRLNGGKSIRGQPVKSMGGSVPKKFSVSTST